MFWVSKVSAFIFFELLAATKGLMSTFSGLTLLWSIMLSLLSYLRPNDE